MKKLGLALVLFLFFSCLGVIATYPLVCHLDEAMPYTHAVHGDDQVVDFKEGDYLQLYYAMWLFHDAIVGDTPFFRDPYQFRVGNNSLYDFSLQFLPLSLIFRILSFLGPIIGYNLLVLVSFPLAGLSMYLLCHHFTRSRWAALLGGTVFALAPYRLAHLAGGHPGGFVMFLLPLVIYLFLKGLEKKRLSFGFLAGICYLSLGLLEFHMIYHLSLFFWVFFPLTLIYIQKKSESQIEYSFDIHEIIQALRNKKTWIGQFLLIIFGLVLGAFVYMYLIRRMQSSYLLLTLPVCSMALYIFGWFYAWVFSKCTQESLVRSLHAWSYAPIVMLLFYALQFQSNIPGLAGKLIALVILTIIFIKVFLLWRYRQEWVKVTGVWIGFREAWFKLFFAFMIPASVYLAWIYYEKSTRLAGSLVASGRASGLIRSYSPSFNDFMTRFNIDGEKFIYLGIIALFLCILAAVYMFLKKDISIKQRLVIGVCTLFFLLTLGLGFGLHPDAPFKGLYQFFYNYIPYFNFQRVPTRIIYLQFCFFSILSAFGLTLLTRSISKRQGMTALISLLFVLGVAIDVLPFKKIGLSKVVPYSQIYAHIEKNIKPDRNVLNIPIWPGDSSWSSLYMWYVTRFPHTTINGYRPAISHDYIQNVFKPLSKINVGQIDEKVYQQLKEWKIAYVVVHEDAFPGKVSPYPAYFTSKRLKNTSYLEYVMREVPGRVLFRVKEDVTSPDSRVKPSTPIGHIIEAETMRTKIGQGNLSGEDVVYALDTGADYLAYGRHRNFPSGSYKARFRLRGLPQDLDLPFMRLEIWEVEADKLITQKILYGKDLKKVHGFRDFEIEYALEEFGEIEPKVFFYGQGEIWFDRVLINFQNTDIFEAEDFFTKCHVVTDSNASGERAVFACREKDEDVDVIYGPYRKYAPGAYQLRYSLKLISPALDQKDRQIAIIYVTSHFGQDIKVSKMLRLSDFKDAENFQSFNLDFNLNQSEILEFKIKYLRKGNFLVDTINIEKSEE